MSKLKNMKYNLWSVLGVILAAEIVFWVFALVILKYVNENEPSFRFEHPKVLYGGLILIPLLIFVTIYLKNWRNKTLRKYADDHLLKHLTKGYSNFKSLIKYTLLRFGLSFLIIAAANPQYGEQEREVVSKGLDIMIALDVSYSMNAEDLVSGKSRLEIAKKSISKLIDQLHGDHIGIVVFAGEAYKQLPITPDYNVAKMFLNQINAEMLSSHGTDIGNAISTCMSAFNPEDPTQKVIVIFSDGEDHEEEGVQMAQTAAEEGIVIHTIGMATTSGVPIPVYEKGKKVGFKTDQDGNTVLTQLNESALIDIANAGNGSYTRAEGYNVGLDALIDQLNDLERQEVSRDQYLSYADHFQIFLLFGLILLLFDTLLTENRLSWWKKLKFNPFK